MQIILTRTVNYINVFDATAMVALSVSLHVQGAGKRQKPPLHSFFTEHPFQIVGVDIMEQSINSRGNRYVVVFQN